MRAVVQTGYGGPEVFELRDVPRPELGHEDVLVRVHAAGLDRGVWHIMAGLPYLVRLGFGLRAPRNPAVGFDVAGRVEAVGSSVTGFGPGDDVFGVGVGSFAEYARVPRGKLAHKPEALTFVEAAAVPVSGITALQGLRDRGGVAAGDRVLITGASGGVGTFAVQIAKALGAEVTGVCSGPKAGMVRSLGADHVIDYRAEDVTLSERRFDVILDIGGNRPLSALRRILAPRGTLVIVGGEEGGRWIGGTDRQLRAFALSPFVSQKLTSFISSERGDDLLALAALIEAGKVRPVVDRTFPLDEVREAMAYLVAGHARGKVVVTVGDGPE